MNTQIRGERNKKKKKDNEKLNKKCPKNVVQSFSHADKSSDPYANLEMFACSIHSRI